VFAIGFLQLVFQLYYCINVFSEGNVGAHRVYAPTVKRKSLQKKEELEKAETEGNWLPFYLLCV